MIKLISLVLFIPILVGCDTESVNSPLYNGESLTIGIIGGTPNVREEQISFTNIDFDELESDYLSDEFDAVFITKEHLPEAAGGDYASTYDNAGIPFFFIESEKSVGPFINEELSYESYPEVNDQTYASGYVASDRKAWGYGLYNDVENEANIMDVYTRIFQTIENGELPLEKLNKSQLLDE